MKTKISLFLFLSTILFSQTIELKKKEWQLAGFSYDFAPNSLELKKGDTIWTYKDNKWFCFKKDYDVSGECTLIENIEAGSGFWIYSDYDNNITLNNNDPKVKDIKQGWNLVVFGKDIDVEEYFKNSYIKVLWSYKNGEWMLYTPDDIIINSLSKLKNLESTQAVWVYATKNWNYVNVGDEKTPLFKGDFNEVVKNSSDDIENIWNISFEIESGDIKDFNIGVKLLKATGAMGELVFTGLNITDGKIDNPDSVIIYGVKSDGTSASTYFGGGYDPDDILPNSISLNGNILTLKLGTIIKKQTIVNEDTFKGVSNYNIKINSDKLKILESKTISLGNITTFDVGDIFDNKNGIEGNITIK